MGRGNWIPSLAFDRDTTFSDQVYVDLGFEPEDDEEEDDGDRFFDADDAYDDLWQMIEECVGSDFEMCDRHKVPPKFDGWRTDDVVFAHSTLAIIVGDPRGDHWHQGVGVIVNPIAECDDNRVRAEIYAAAVAVKLFDHLAEWFPGRVSSRNGAWMSSPYVPSTAVSAA